MKSATAPARAGANGQEQQTLPKLPFVKATRATTEPFGDNTEQMLASDQVTVADTNVPAFGWFRSILIWVVASGGTASGTNAVAREDAPFNVLQNLSLVDTNGKPLVGPFNGWDLYLVNKWAPTVEWALDAKSSPVYSAPDAGGNFSFVLRLPSEVGGRDGLGSLANAQSNSKYRVSYNIAAASTVFSTQPGGALPSVRVRMVMESYAPVDAAAPNGQPQETSPPFDGTTMHVSKSTPTVASGDKQVDLTRVGYMIRSLIFTLRTSAPARTTSDFPSQMRLLLDNKQVDVIYRDIQRHLMWQRTGLTPDTGVLVWDYTHDLDGRSGGELRDLWLPTSTATRLTLEGTWGGSAVSLEVLTSDVAAPAAQQVVVANP